MLSPSSLALGTVVRIRCQREVQMCWCWKSETPEEPCCSPCSQQSKRGAQLRSQPGGGGWTWSFRLFVLLSMAITSGLSLLGKGCQQVRSCFPNSKIIPALPALPSLCLPFYSPPFFPLSLFLFPFLSCHFPSFYFPFSFFLSCPASLLGRRGEQMPLSPL